MKIAALISGGKDSIFSMMKALEMGHNVVALVNFYPPASTGSFSFFLSFFLSFSLSFSFSFIFLILAIKIYI